MYVRPDDIDDVVRAHVERRKHDKPTNGFRRFSEIRLDDLTFKVKKHFEAIGLLPEYETEIASLTSNVVQSPIERAMLAFLRFDDYGGNVFPDEVGLYLPGEYKRARVDTGTSIALLPQHQVCSYFLDIGMHVECCGQILRIDVECDGVEFHYSKGSQVEHDRLRDEIIFGEGYRVWRAHGTHINRNPLYEAEKLTELVGAWISELRADAAIHL